MLFDRTFHPDEANQAFTVGHLLETGRYTYQPQDHHGPTLYYAAAPLQKAFGHTSTATLDGTLLRCTPLVFAVFTLVMGFVAFRKLTKSFWAAFSFIALLGTAPIFVFFATDFIQEMLLTCFLMLMFFAGVNYFQPGSRIKPGSWALIFGIGAGLAFATKETSVLSFGAALLAVLPFRRTFTLPRSHLSHASQLSQHVPFVILGFGLTVALFFSSFGADFHGLYNALVAAPHAYLHRAAGEAAAGGADWHVHPWWQYLEWLYCGKAVISTKNGFHLGATVPHILPMTFLLVMLPICALRKVREALPRTLIKAFLFCALYTALLLVFYSLIRYKTPWCTLQIYVGEVATCVLGLHLCHHCYTVRSLYHGVSAKGLDWCCRFLPTLMTLFFVAIAIGEENIPALCRLWTHPDSHDIPYNYAGAHAEVKELAQIAETALSAAERPAVGPVAARAADPFVAVALPACDTWPFPWYNRANEAKTGYWNDFDALKRLAEAGSRPAVVIVPMTEGHLVQPLFPHLKNTKRFFIRPGVRARIFW